MRTEKNISKKSIPGRRIKNRTEKELRPANKQGAGEESRNAGERRTETDYYSDNIQSRDRIEKEEQERLLHQKRREERRAMQKERRARAVRRQKILLVFAAVIVVLIVVVGEKVIHKAWASSNLSDEVLAYRDTMEKYAEKEGIEEYVDVLLAIMMVESEGGGEDVMQSSESKGLDRNTLNPEESIEQACIYFAALLEIAEDLGIKDEKALIQAYNFGPGYLNFLAENGKKHRQKLAIEYAKEQSGGEKVRYMHFYAIKKNGGWIYKFGNMFYDAIVQNYL